MRIASGYWLFMRRYCLRAGVVIYLLTSPRSLDCHLIVRSLECLYSIETLVLYTLFCAGCQKVAIDTLGPVILSASEGSGSLCVFPNFTCSRWPCCHPER